MAVTLSLVMPALNEEAGLERAVARAKAACASATDAYEIIVVDDGSIDGTGRIADRLAADDPEHVRVLHHERTLNYGAALRHGFQAARHEWVLHDGVDLPLAPEDIGLFVRHFADADVIVARRTSRRAHSAWRRATSWTNRALLRVLFAPRTEDLNFVQFYRRALVLSLPLTSTSPAFVTPELIMRAERTGRRVRQVTVEFRRRESGRPHFGKLHDIAWTLRDMAAFRVRTWLRGWDR